MRKILYQAIFVLFYWFSSSAIASTLVYLKVYTPVYTDDMEVEPELDIIQNMFIGNMVEEEYLKGAIIPYNVYEFDFDSTQKSVRNINPASKINIKIIPSLYPVEKCRVILDISDMKPIKYEKILGNEEPIITTINLLEKVAIATEMNLAASKYKNSCGFMVKGMEKHPEIKDNIKDDSILLKTIINEKEKYNAKTY